MKNENIKMRVNKNKESECDCCGEKWKNVPEIYDIMIFGEIHTICMKCTQELFCKILKADCLYNSRLKSDEDVTRERNFEHKYGRSIHVIGYGS